MKSENWSIVLYPEDKECSRVLEYIKLNFEYAYMLHDKDITEDGEKKKEHIHVFFQFENARSLESVAEELHIPVYDLKKISSKRGAIRYLTHIDHPEKYQYSKDNIVSNIEIEKYFKEKENEGEDIAKIIMYLYGEKRKVSICEVMCYAIDNKIYASFRRAGNQMIKIIEEHNKIYEKRNKFG